MSSTELLSYEQKCSAVRALTMDGTLSKQEAEIYILRELGDGKLPPPIRYQTISKRLGIRDMTTMHTMRRVRPIADAALVEAVRGMIRIETTEGLPEEMLGIDCRVTLQFGHEAKTRVDGVAQGVLRTLHRRDAA